MMPEYEVRRTMEEVHVIEAEDAEAAEQKVEYMPTDWLWADITVAAEEVVDR